ncbi:hypothetical protein ACN26Y_27095 [Micromonospora sp. WMMD558]|uniref:hypothetical protein n=1 Tax=unclassified Micromonospora TaxID=2617518 RepID=UPI0012B48793|nr:hypothetical protein [Micromonospora sp. WMMC415]QGN49598.1 hypothetical protein GKC29_24020 [Micromonospora sp. WMMC415]
MLPVALTCPLWWVARWASRLLAGLALTAGLSVGVAAPAHPVGTAEVRVASAAGDCVALPAPGATTGSAPVALDAPAAGTAPQAAPAWSGADAAPPAAAVPGDVERVTPVTTGECGSLAGRFPAGSGSRAPPRN